MVAEASSIKPLTYDQKDMIVSLFDNITVAHVHLARAAGTMSNLCKVLDPQQLMLIMNNAVCPLIQLNISLGLFDLPAKPMQKELPDDIADRVHDMMILVLTEKTFIKEVHFNSTRLLVVMLAFYLDWSFGKTCMMKEVWEKFIIRLKPLSLCIMGRKYLGSLERKAQLKKNRKAGPHRDGDKGSR